jgi:ABC-type transporter Mla subunit MlaD
MVGLFAAAAMAILYLGIDYLKGNDFFSSSSKYYAIYENVDNLAVSNPVLVSGFAVGRVSKIKIMPNKTHSVLVEIDIDSDIKLGDSTKAILDSELLGSKYILLSIGEVKEPLLPGDTIYSELAKGMFDVLTETAQPVASNVESSLRKFNVVIENLARNSQRLDSIFISLQSNDEVIVVGEARSHCVANSLRQLMQEVPSLAPKLTIFTDCMSDVPNLPATFYAEVQKIYDDAKALGVKFSTTSTYQF